MVWRRGCDQNEIDIRSLQASIFQCSAGSSRTQRYCRFAFASNVTLTNTCTLDNPFVRGFNHALKIGILHDPLRQSRTNTSYDRSYHLVFLS